ncbi:MAG: hypothetical protein ACE5IK_11885, partial [Acidobacteriota bacterium]
MSETQVYPDRLGRIVKQVDAMGAASLTRYDGLGRPVWQQVPTGSEATVEFDANGNVTRRTVTRFTQEPDFGLPPAADLTAPITQQTDFTYDTLDRLVTVTDAAGGVSTRVHDSRGVVRRTIDALGNVVEADVDALGRTTASRQEKRTGGSGSGALEASLETRFTYDDASRLLAQIDALGRVTRYTYDGLGRRIERRYEGLAGDTARTARWFYDADGRVVTRIDDRGVCVKQSFDSLARLTRAEAYESCTVSGTAVTAFDRGALAGTFAQTFTYDGLGRLLTRQEEATATGVTPVTPG